MDPSWPMVPLQFCIVAFLKQVLKREEGQNLVEYTLVVALIALGSIVGPNHLAAALNQVFSSTAGAMNRNL